MYEREKVTAMKQSVTKERIWWEEDIIGRRGEKFAIGGTKGFREETTEKRWRGREWEWEWKERNIIIGV